MPVFVPHNIVQHSIDIIGTRAQVQRMLKLLKPDSHMFTAAALFSGTQALDLQVSAQALPPERHSVGQGPGGQAVNWRPVVNSLAHDASEGFNSHFCLC